MERDSQCILCRYTPEVSRPIGNTLSLEHQNFDDMNTNKQSEVDGAFLYVTSLRHSCFDCTWRMRRRAALFSLPLQMGFWGYAVERSAVVIMLLLNESLCGSDGVWEALSQNVPIHRSMLTRLWDGWAEKGFRFPPRVTGFCFTKGSRAAPI